MSIRGNGGIDFILRGRRNGCFSLWNERVPFHREKQQKKRFIFVTYLSSEILKLLRKMSVYQIQLCNLHTY